MGKKKQKKASATRTSNDVAPPAPAPAPAPPSFISPLSKAIFILLSIGGHFNANEYTHVLDNFPSETDIHNDDEVDAIINAMEYHEQDRITFSKAMRLLADAITESIESKSKSMMVSNEEKMDHYHGFGFESIESCSARLSLAISSYQILISKQRVIMVELYQVVKTTLTLAAGVAVDEDGDRRVYPFLQYMIMFQLLSQQYIRQLDWETRVISKLANIMQDGGIYPHSHFQSDDDDAPTSTRSRSRNGFSIHGDLKMWATGVAQCSMLDKTQWLKVKQMFVKQIMSIAQVDTASGEGGGGGEGSPEEMKGESSIPSTEMETHPLDSAIALTVSSMNSLSGQILKSQSIHGAINSFAGHAIFCTSLYEPESAMHDSTDSIGSATSNSLFLLLTGPPGSGKSFFCDALETKVAKLNQEMDEESRIVGELCIDITSTGRNTVRPNDHYIFLTRLLVIALTTPQ